MSRSIDPAQVIDHAAALEGVQVHRAWGETSCFYNPGGVFARGTYFLTIKEKDGDNDRASGLDREGVWRLNIGTAKPDFEALFGPPPKRPGKGGTIEGPWDFTSLDQITPHPVYGWMSWIAIVSPRPETWRRCIPLVDSAYAKARTTFERRLRAAGKASA